MLADFDTSCQDKTFSPTLVVCELLPVMSEALTLDDYRQDKQRWMREVPVALQRRRHMSVCVMFVSPLYLPPLHYTCKRKHLLQRKPSMTPHKWEKKKGGEMYCEGTKATSLPAVIPEGKLCLEHRRVCCRLNCNQLNLCIVSLVVLCMKVTSLEQLAEASFGRIAACILLINLKDAHFVQHRTVNS